MILTRLLEKAKDGGEESTVDAYFLFEWKDVCSVALLKFNKGGRKAFHTHAFHAWTWLLWGSMQEETRYGELSKITSYRRSLKPKVTRRERNHRVLANRTSWCFTVRGPWAPTWTEHLGNKRTVFTWGRKVWSSI